MRRLLSALVVLALGVGVLVLARDRLPWMRPAPPSLADADLIPALRDDAPRWMRFDSREHDFGEVLHGDPAEHRFEFEVLEDVWIEGLSASCGCLSSELLRLEDGEWQPIEPGLKLPAGTRAAVLGRLETAARNARESSRLRLRSNDPDAPELRLSLRMDLVELFALEPERVHQAGFVRSEGIRGAVRVTPIGAERIRATRLGEGTPGIVARLVAGPDDRHVDVELQAHPAENMDHFAGRQIVWFETDAAEGERPLTIPISGGVLPDVVADPRILMFPSMPRGTGRQAEVQLHAPDDSVELHLESVRIDSDDAEDLEVDVETLEPGRRYRLHFHVLPDRAPGRFGGKLEVRHDLSPEPLVIRFAGHVAE